MAVHWGGRGPGHMSRQTTLSFNPLALFSASEPGGWYDPSDLTTLYQDSAGTTPVTAAGQTVGLMLDKSQGLVLGPELVSNGGFDSDTGWTKGTGWTIGGGTANASVASGFTDIRNTTFVPVVGKTYEMCFDLLVTSGGVRPYLGGVTHPATLTATGSYRLIVTATTANYVAIIAYGGGGAFTGSIDNISVRELPGNHATQATTASRPLYQVDGTGRPYLLFDGTDDFLVTPTITPGTDKAQVFAGARKLSDAAEGIVIEPHTGSLPPNRISLYAPRGALARYGFQSGGTAVAEATSATSFAAPITNIITVLGDIASDVATLRVNGTQAASSATDQGTGNFVNAPLYIGRRGGTSLPFNGRLYGIITRFGPTPDAATIAKVESWMNSRTGAY